MSDIHSLLGHPPPSVDVRTGMSRPALRRAVLDHLFYTRAKSMKNATGLDLYHALALAVRDRLIHRWLATQNMYQKKGVRRVCYLSSEFLVGRSLGLCLFNLGLYEDARAIMAERQLDLNEVLEQEGDPGLGNGGLGRLAACFMDSLATLALPGVGYGIRYRFGIFEQLIEDGQQVERRDDWLSRGNPWELPRHELTQTVRFGGHTVHQHDASGRLRVVWNAAEEVLGVPFDSFIVGHHTNNVNTLRLWSARSTVKLDLKRFNAGDYLDAVAEKTEVESISKVLYPSDSTDRGKALRLKQQYFFVACSLADVIRRHKREHGRLDSLHESAIVQLNDTHPSIAVPELMRLLLDVEGFEWEQAWSITKSCFAYTNHTLLPEALEVWSTELMRRVLPRHLEIIYEINRRFLARVELSSSSARHDLDRVAIVTSGPNQQIRMAHLAAVACFKVNGVAELHSELVKRKLLRDFAELWPEKFVNVTNGVSPRRWLLHANPGLAQLLSRYVGCQWEEDDFRAIRQLEEYVEDDRVLDSLAQVKQGNKQWLAARIRDALGVSVDPTTMFVTQVKRIHEYKRQLMAILHVASEYLSLRDDPSRNVVPKTFIFGGKAAPDYTTAKRHIQLIHEVARTIDADPLVRGKLQVVFLPNYGVTWAERIIPAADLSVQISLAGCEASGTSNMKFAMNGAITIGTLDGANVEIFDEVGHDSFFLFGLKVDDVQQLREGGYRPRESIAKSERLSHVLSALERGDLSRGGKDRFLDVVGALRDHDPYMVCADFDAYCDAQDRASEAYRDRRKWSQSCLRNVARSARFSSDAAILSYARDIWNVHPMPVDMDVELDGLEGAPMPAHSHTFVAPGTAEEEMPIRQEAE